MKAERLAINPKRSAWRLQIGRKGDDEL